jgi:hypothetical protein
VKAVEVFLLFEAESEAAAAAALQQFAFESFGTKLAYISHFYCEEVKSKCENVLLQAGDVDMLTPDWADCARAMKDSNNSVL